MVHGPRAIGCVKQLAQFGQRGHVDHRCTKRRRSTAPSIGHPLRQGTPATVGKLVEDLHTGRTGLPAEHSNALPVKRMPSVMNRYFCQFAGIM